MKTFQRIAGCGCLIFVFVFVLGTILMALQDGCSIAFLASAGIAALLLLGVWRGFRRDHTLPVRAELQNDNGAVGYQRAP